MGEGRKKLSRKEIAFICQECSITKDELFAFDEDELYDRVYDVMCDIEIAEIPDNNEPESERCIIASHIVTILGNALAKAEGWMQGDDE